VPAGHHVLSVVALTYSGKADCDIRLDRPFFCFLLKEHLF